MGVAPANGPTRPGAHVERSRPFRWVLWLLLLSYPSRFRRDYGHELIAVLQSRRARERRRAGRIAGLRYSLASLVDLVAAGLRFRFRRSHSPAPPPRPGRSREARMPDLFLHDLRVAGRVLARQPLFTLLAVMSLAIGIGASTAVFGLADMVLIRSLPVEDPDRLVVPLMVRDDGQFAHNFSYPDYADLRDRTESVALAAYSPTPVTLGVDRRAERVVAEYVSENYFEVAGVVPAVGRTLAGMATTGDGGIVLSHATWQARFGADPEIVGRRVLLNGVPVPVVGVAPTDFTGTYPGREPALWIPFVLYASTGRGPYFSPTDLERRNMSWLYLVGRLEREVTRQRAVQQINAVARTLADEYSDCYTGERRLALMPGARGHYGVLDNLTTPLTLVMAVVGLLLLIACANVANLLLARATFRIREIGIRSTLGAGRLRLVRQLLLESLVLTAAGGLLGLMLATWCGRALAAYLTAIADRSLRIGFSLDLRVLGFGIGLSAATALVFGSVPAVRASRPDIVEALKGSRRGALGAPTSAGQKVLAVAQVALSFALLAGAGLLGRSVMSLSRIDPGFDRDGVLLAKVDASLADHDAESGRRLFRQLGDALAGVPGVEAVTYGLTIPVDPAGRRGAIFVSERPDYDEEVDQTVVGPGYFETMGIPLMVGRGFSDRDVAQAPRVVVVNETLAETLWPGHPALGRVVRLGGPDGPAFEVVGVARDGRYRHITEERRPYLYFTVEQYWSPNLNLVVRTAGDPRTFVDAIRGTVAKVDAELPLFDIRTLEEQVASSYYETRLSALLLGLFSFMGTVLAALGLYGVLAHTVARRRHEIGVRMALGARAPTVVGMVMRQGMLLSATGVVAGLMLTVAATNLFGALLYGVAATDPGTLAATTGVVVAVAALAGWLPARRATRVDPLLVLRGD